MITTENGLKKEINYNSWATISSTEADSLVSNEVNTDIISSPQPVVDKSVSGVYRLGGVNYVYVQGGQSQVTYSINYSNTYKTRGGETIFNPVITDDLTDIFAKLTASCSEANPENRISAISDDGVLNIVNKEIVWSDLDHLTVGNSKVVSFRVDYSDCAEDIVIDNDVTFSADNIDDLTDNEEVVIGLDLDPKGTFAKGDAVPDAYAGIAVAGIQLVLVILAFFGVGSGLKARGVRFFV